MYTIEMFTEDSPVKALLDKVDLRLSPSMLGVFLGSVVESYMQRRASERFAAEGDSASGKWAPLTEGTQNIRASQGYGAAHPINVRTGELHDFITKAPGSVVADPQGATLTMPGPEATGNLLESYITAQTGQKERDDGMRPAPARPVLAMDKIDLRDVTLETLFWVVGKTAV